jgi:hypothetical protein
MNIYQLLPKLRIYEIYDHDCLNRLGLKMINEDYRNSYAGELLIRYCQTKNASKLNIIDKLVKIYDYELDGFLWQSLINKCFDISDYCIVNGAKPNLWIFLIKYRNVDYEYANILDEFQYLLKHNAINLQNLHNELCNCQNSHGVSKFKKYVSSLLNAS